MVIYWRVRVGWRMWRTWAAGSSIFLTNTQSPGWYLGKSFSFLSQLSSRFAECGGLQLTQWVQLVLFRRCFPILSVPFLGNLNSLSVNICRVCFLYVKSVRVTTPVQYQQYVK